MNEIKYSYKPYEEKYLFLFSQEKKRLELIFGKRVTINHIGSTAVSGLGGKGIIDIYLTANKSDIVRVSNHLQKQLGYDFRPKGGDDRRLFFVAYKKDREGVIRTYHIHLTDPANPDYKKAISLRDYLRVHPQEAKRYDFVKKQASAIAMESNDYEKQKGTYQKSKASFLKKLNEKSLNWRKKA